MPDGAAFQEERNTRAEAWCWMENHKVLAKAPRIVESLTLVPQMNVWVTFLRKGHFEAPYYKGWREL